MYNLRYHIASLVAVFLALAVGLLLGTVVAERGTISNQATALVGQLQTRFDEISAENDVLQEGLERDRAFAEAVAPVLTAGKLQGANVAVVVDAGAAESAKPVVDAINGAGGRAFTASITTQALGLDKAEPEGLAGYYQLRGAEMAAAGPVLEKQVAQSLAAEWMTPADRSLTSVLVASGVLVIESTVDTAPVAAIVVVGDGKSGADSFAVELARAMSKSGGTALGAETAPVKDGVAQTFAGAGLSAVDHAGTPQGRLSLVWLLTGKAKGYFGSGDGAQAYFPEIGS